MVRYGMVRNGVQVMNVGRTLWQRSQRGMVAFAVAAILLFAALLVAAPAAQSSTAATGAHLGVASCAGSTCHGRMAGDGAVVRQDELARWQEPSTQGGAHSRAYAVLQNARSEAIARNLGITNAASSSQCTGCHSSAATGARLLTDGVDCEACHGNAGGYIASHYAGLLSGTAQHADNVRRGMVALEDASTRAGVCLDCHFGSDSNNQFVSHRLMAAGHPRISFELDLFSTLSAHHNEDADYSARKGAPDHVQLWAVGQAMALRRSLTLFQTNAGSAGIFPEFYFYDCHSCHRRIFDQADANVTAVANPGRPIPAGMPPYNDENMIMLSAAAHVAAPALADRFDAKVRAFHAAMANGRTATTAAARDLAATTGELVATFERASFGGAGAQRMAAAIGSRATAARFTDYEGAVQAVMGIDTLLSAMVSSGTATPGSAAAIRGDINRAYAAVREPNSFRPRDFQAAIASAVRGIGAL